MVVQLSQNERVKNANRRRYTNDAEYRQYIADQTRRQRLEKQEWLKSFKKTLSCSRCQFSDYRALEFHHKDPSTKEFTICRALHQCHMSIERIKQELEKCEVVCSNCHRIEHYVETHADVSEGTAEVAPIGRAAVL